MRYHTDLVHIDHFILNIDEPPVVHTWIASGFIYIYISARL